MHIIEITEKEASKYNQFVQNHPLGSIHQTFEWGKFQTQLAGRDKFWCLAVENDQHEIVASALLIRQTLPFKKSWIYCPRGPLVDYGATLPTPSDTPKKESETSLLIQKIADIGKKNNAIFFRFDPPIESAENINWKLWKSQKSHAHYQPENTLIIDLTQPLDDILKHMKPKGRYNIKVADKHGVHVRVSDGNQSDIDAFYTLLAQTTSRDAFSGHNKKYYSDMLTILGQDKAKLYLAEYQGKTVAGLIATYFNQTAIYYFGASSNEYRNIMAPYLLQWQAMQDAKNAGFTEYDFLGIAPEEAQNHPWAGVTDFKLKFGGKRVNFEHAQEIVWKPFWYFVIKLVKKLKR